MPLTEREYNLPTVADDLADDMAEKATEQASFPKGSDGAKQAAEEGQQLQHYRAGVLWALDFPGNSDIGGAGWDTDTITLASLKNGERRMIADITNEYDMVYADLYVAAGTIDAPYLDHDPYATTKDDLIETALNVADLHPKFVDWLESELSDLSGMGAEGNAYRTLVQEKRTSETSQT